MHRAGGHVVELVRHHGEPGRYRAAARPAVVGVVLVAVAPARVLRLPNGVLSCLEPVALPDRTNAGSAARRTSGEPGYISVRSAGGGSRATSPRRSGILLPRSSALIIMRRVIVWIGGVYKSVPVAEARVAKDHLAEAERVAGVPAGGAAERRVGVAARAQHRGVDVVEPGRRSWGHLDGRRRVAYLYGEPRMEYTQWRLKLALNDAMARG
jgi:hypothetical protein